ncbi:acyltransferase family protein [Novosphingobium bradum]|uniref:Acyltransferase family protein n=1 Tax=Novosphingobium bradum TaxID=1737444 RepID=A0ABV7IRL1_9SPHN
MTLASVPSECGDEDRVSNPASAPLSRQHQASAPTDLALLNGVRGLAAIAILFWHYQHFYFPVGLMAPVPGFTAHLPGYAVLWPLYDFGNYAVQAFWMLSGVVFAHVYLSARSSGRDFAINRFARLYPLHLLTFVVVGLLQGAVLSRFGATFIYGPGDGWTALQHLGMASGWGFPRGRESFNGPIWSVSAEVVVYALFWFARPLLRRRPVAAPVLVAAMAMALCAVGLENEIVRCLYHFMLGVALYTLSGALRTGQGVAAAAFGAAVASAAVAAANPSVAIIAGGGAVMLTCLLLERRVGRPLTRVCDWLGDNTYGLYLWHVPVQLSLLLLFPARHALPALASRPAFLVAFLVGMMLLARLSFLLIERPARILIRRRLAGQHSAVAVPAA